MLASRTRARRLHTLLAAAAAVVTLPAAAHAAQPLSLVDDREALGPGVELNHEHYLTAAGWVDRHVLTANLADPAVTSDLLHAYKVAQGSALSTQANAAGAVAGVNGDFFDIGNSGASLGFEFAGGRLRKSGTRNNGQSVGVTQSGIGRLANLALAARATFGFQDHPIAGYNQVGIPTDGIGAYTSEWGSYDRATQVGGAADPAEVWVANGKVTRAQPPAAGTLPEGTTALVGREAGAAALRTLAVGDDVALSYAVSPAMQDRFRFALGTDVQLVRDGAAVPDSESGGGASGNSVAPRTAIGFKDEGRTMILLTVDGPGGTGRGGVTLPQMAHMLDDLGAEMAVNLDGGGSTTMVARPLGNPLATVRNVPSDGSERSDPNGVGVFVAPGNGEVEDLVVGGVAKVFPGLHRTLSVAAIDDHKAPAELDRSAVGWTAEDGSIAGGLFKAPEQGDRTVRVRATTATARADAQVRVLGRLRSLELSTTRLSIPEPTSAPTILTVTGRDGQGYTAPVEAADLELDHDPAVVKIQPAGDALAITPVAQGGTLITIGAGDQTVKLPTTVGVNTTTVYEFDNADEHQRWITNGTQGTEKILSIAPEGLRLDYKKARNMGVTKFPNETRIDVPGQPLPSSGKAPYGTPDRGGITGWVKWSVDSDARAGDQWLTADARPFASTIELNTPASVEVGTSATLSGSILQPSGVDQNGTRRVPLAYPMSVHWGGSDSLAIGSGEDAIDAARKAGKVAILDPATRAITGLRTGNVKVSVTVDSMREYTGEASLAPIRTERVIDVRAYTGPGPRFSAPVPVFPPQPTGTISPAQSVEVTNEGDRPLEITGVRIVPGDAGSEGEFLLVGDDCTGAQVAPGATCTALVRFAPSRPNATFSAALVFDTNTADRVHSVALSATSTDLPRSEDGADGIDGAAAPPAPVPVGKRGAPRGAPVVSVRCRLVNGRRGVRCTVSTTARSRLKASVRVGRRSRTVSRAGKVTVTVRTGRRLTSRSRVRVRAAVGDSTAVVSVKPGRSARATLTR